MKNRRILYVDDTEGNLNTFKALFRRDYDVYISTNPVDAVSKILEHDIAVVLTDYKMPHMTGVQFLERVRELYPYTVRILISGHADIEAVIESINKGGVFRFIRKPWIDEIIKNEITHAFELYDTRVSLKEKSDQLQKAYEELSYFTYSAAHNLTGPVATIQGLVELIKKDPDQTETLLDYIDNTALALRNHLKNIIAFNQNKSEVSKLSTIDLNAFIAQVLEEFKFYPDYSTLKVTVDISQDEELVSDEHRLSMILTNLVTNAIKYRDQSKEKSILTIDVHVAEGALSLKVRDNGVGIASENLDKVTRIFYREPSSELGSGIGMYIVEQAIKKLQGELSIDSIKGEYAEFDVRIPNQKK